MSLLPVVREEAIDLEVKGNGTFSAVTKVGKLISNRTFRKTSGREIEILWELPVYIIIEKILYIDSVFLSFSYGSSKRSFTVLTLT